MTNANAALGQSTDDPSWRAARDAISTGALALLLGLVAAGLAQAAPGDADGSYGQGGVSTLHLGGDRDQFLDFTAGAADATYVFGRDDGTGSQETYVVRRLDANGSVDASFGSEGSVLVSTAQPFGTRFSSVYVDETAQRLYLGGSSCNGSTCTLTTGRYNFAGQPDTAWGPNGLARTSIAGGAYRMLRQRDGKLVGLVGNASEGGGFCSGDPALFRLTSAGAPDPGFGSNGRAVHDFGSPYDVPVHLAIDADDRLLVSGYTGTMNCGTQNAAIIRVLPNGNIDNGFGSNGLYTANFGGTSESGFLPVAQAGGKVSLAYLSMNQSVTASASTSLGILRLTAGGVPDATFGGSGRQAQTFSKPASVGSPFVPSLVQSTGKLLLAGSSSDVLVYRYSGSTELVGVGNTGNAAGSGGSGGTTPGSQPGTGSGSPPASPAPVTNPGAAAGGAGSGGGSLALLNLLMLAAAGACQRSRRIPKAA